jgi:hypothetical protein
VTKGTRRYSDSFSSIDLLARYRFEAGFGLSFLQTEVFVYNVNLFERVVAH